MGHGHDHHSGEDPETLREHLREIAGALYHSMIEHQAIGVIEEEAFDQQDVFFFSLYADAFGIPTPVSYYTVELLPYFAEDFEAWERRMWDKKLVTDRRHDQYHF